MAQLSYEVRYGFGLYKFALLIAVGIFVSRTGPTILQTFTQGMATMQYYSLFLLTGILVLQLAGFVIAAAGFFGALYKVLNDANE